MSSNEYHDRLKAKRKELAGRRDGLRLVFLLGLTIVLLVIVFSNALEGVFVHMSDKPDEVPDLVQHAERPIPEIDDEILTTVRDETSSQRYGTEPLPLRHLLDAARKLYPDVLRRMGMSTKGEPISALRNDPARFRGKPVWFQGELMQVDGTDVPGLADTRLYRGRLRTQEGEVVLFAVISKPAAELVPGSQVRVEGLFYKLMDDAFRKVEKAPYVIGAQLREAFVAMAPVETLDPEVLAQARDDSQEAGRRLEAAPLYHLASHVLQEDWTEEETAKGYTQMDTAPATGILERPDEQRGKGYTIVGEMAHVQVISAEANPLGIERWSRVFIWQRDLKMFEVRVPGEVSTEHFAIGKFVQVRARFLKNSFHETSVDPRTGVMRTKWTPLFVGIPSQVLRWQVVENEETLLLRLMLGGLAILLIVIFLWLVRSDGRSSKDATERLMKIRKRRREAGK